MLDRIKEYNDELCEFIGSLKEKKNELHEPEKLAEHLGKLESSGQLLLGIINM